MVHTLNSFTIIFFKYLTFFIVCVIDSVLIGSQIHFLHRLFAVLDFDVDFD